MSVNVLEATTATRLPAREIVVPWARYPTITEGGRISRAKNAGKPLPWLSINVINNLPRPLYRVLRGMWRDAVRDACANVPVCHGLVLVGAHLYKPTANAMDPVAVIEGIKPCVDGLVLAGVLPDDDNVIGGMGFPAKAESRACCRLELKIWPL